MRLQAYRLQTYKRRGITAGVPLENSRLSYGSYSLDEKQLIGSVKLLSIRRPTRFLIINNQ